MIPIDEQLVKRVVTPRPKTSHRGTFGRAVLIDGDEQYGGAVIMSALVAVCSGTGLTAIVTDEKNRSALHSRLPEAMIVDWMDTDQLLSMIKQADVLLIGPGLDTSSKSLERFRQILEDQLKEQWLVIDGSALSLLAINHLSLSCPEQTMLTPRQMEWQRLSALSMQKQWDEENRKKQQEISAAVVLKSHETKIYGHQHFYTSPLGSTVVAAGGMGDALAGMITGFLAQFPQDDQTVAAAVYLHSFIGDQLAKERYVVLPTQIDEALPKWINYLCKKSMGSEAWIMEKFTGCVREPFCYKTDQMGITHHSNYIRWFEEARVALLAHLGLPHKKIEESGITIPVLEVNCSYKGMIHYGEKVSVHPTIQKYTGTCLGFNYEIVGTEDKKLKTTGSNKHCFLLSDSRRLMKLGKVNPELGQLFQAYASLDNTIS